MYDSLAIAYVENEEKEISLWRWVLGHMDDQLWWEGFAEHGEQEQNAYDIAGVQFADLQREVVNIMLNSNIAACH